MFRGIVIALSLFAVAACGSETESTQADADLPTTEPTTTLNSPATTDTPAAVSDPPTTVGVTVPPEPPATTEVLITGADSSKDAVTEWYTGIAENDLSRMWAILDPELRVGVVRSAWDACIAAQFEVQIESFQYDESETYEENGATFSTGSATVKAGGDEATLRITFEVVERAGGWFTVGPVTYADGETCLEQSAS